MVIFRDLKFRNNIRKKKLKALHNSVSLEEFLPLSIMLIFSPFTSIFVKKGFIVFQKVASSVNFLYLD